LLSGVIEEQGLQQHQVVLGRYCWKLRPVDDDGRARESRAPLHPIYKVRQLFGDDCEWCCVGGLS
jgi:hypothetical protein